MSNRRIVVTFFGAAITAAIVTAQQSTPPTTQSGTATPAPVRSGGVVVPTITLGPGLTPVPNYNEVTPPIPAPQIPEGFEPLFNGTDLSGWHVSKTARHGHTPEFRVVHGVLMGTQHPYGQGGMLVTDKKYRNFELTLEAKPDWGCDSGIFFRTTETGAAYQITMDYLGNNNGNLGRLIGEGGISLGSGRAGGAGSGAAGTPSAASQAWKREDWNVIRLRVEGPAPKVSVWINNQLVNEQQDAANHAPEGMIEGPIALQVHGGTERWVPGGFWRWRNIGIKELPN
jgi:3-keto-disaccharide hydrolase